MNQACYNVTCIPLTPPGSVPFIFIMESIIEHVAKSLGKDPLEVRKLNLYTKGQVRGIGWQKIKSLIDMNWIYTYYDYEMYFLMEH